MGVRLRHAFILAINITLECNAPTSVDFLQIRLAVRVPVPYEKSRLPVLAGSDLRMRFVALQS